MKRLMMKAIVPALLIAAASNVHAAEPEAPACVFDKYAPVVVKPYSQDENLAYGRFSFLRGAQLYVPAREGMTREWLTATMQRALATARSGDVSCSPHVKDVQVYVSSAGHGFWIQLIGKDERTANVLLKWAQGLVDQQRRAERTLASQ